MERNIWQVTEYGTIRFSVKSDGTTGPEWIEWYRANGFHVGEYGDNLLRSLDFQPTSGVQYEVAVLSGWFFPNMERTTKNILAEGERRGWQRPNLELACLIGRFYARSMFQAVGLEAMIVMHSSIKELYRGDPDNDEYLNGWFGVSMSERNLGIFSCGTDSPGWPRFGFAFVLK